jgi:hypothetical protein
MSRREFAFELVELADQLGLGGAADPVDAILRHCRHRIDRWVADARDVTTIGQLEALVTRKLQMVFEEIRSDADFDRIKEQYARVKKDPVFATMRFPFDDAENPTFGALVKRNVGADAPDRFVAVIDCRGNKLARRFFTRWHEIAHRLTTHADQGAEEPAYRSEHDPIERMMDEIAGHVGFYGPFFEPVFSAAHAGKALLTFETVKAVQDGGFPEASFQATLNACARRLPTPVMYIEAMLAYKKEVKRRLATPSLFGDDPPPGQLRAVKVIQNEAAQQEKIVIPTNMRVPESSVICLLFENDGNRDAASREDLGIWSDSKGKKLEGRAVAIEARRVADRVIAIVQPVEPVRQQPHRPKVKGLYEE